MELTKHQKRILALASKGGTDKELALLEEIFALEEKMDAIEERHKEEMAAMKDMMMEMKTGIPQFGALIESIKQLAEKETPATIVNVPETRVEVKAPVVNVAAPNIKMDMPMHQVIPAPIVNIKTDQFAAPHPEAESLREEIAELRKELGEKVGAMVRPTIFGPGKTKILIKDLSSQLDGVTKTFAIGAHFGIIGVFGSSSPFPFRPTVDYTEVGKNIVFDAAINAEISLAAGQTLIVQYLK